jgi:hypothetical protein
MSANSRDERSIGELFAELAGETSTLVRQEMQLAKTELSQKATEAATDAAWVGAGGALLHAGLLALVAAAIIGLGQIVPAWVSALVIGLVVAGVGYLLVKKGLDAFKRLDPAPRETIETLRDDKNWAKEQLQ